MSGKKHNDGDFSNKGFGLPPLEPVSKMPPIKKPPKPDKNESSGGKQSG